MAEDTRQPVASVKFTPVGRVHTFLLPEFADPEPLTAGDAVVVRERDRTGVATVVRTPSVVVRRRAPVPEGRVVRRASKEDVLTRIRQEQRERDAFRIGLMKIRERGLPMKLTRVEQHFDGSKLVFYFTADGRVDFRELVRDLAAEFRTRIEMRQIGVRDEARLLGGYGSCGRPLCCTTWLVTFEPVSIKMAKRQQLSLNPSKLSGLCGRLKCCLRYELPNAAGTQFAGCAHEATCGSGASGSGCGGGCGSGGACGSGDGCGSCGAAR